jgi:hypothetical protein
MEARKTDSYFSGGAMKHDESDPEEDLQDEETSEAEDDEVEEPTDNVGDPSVEINVEALIHELEVQGITDDLGREAAARRRLEELMEQRRARRELEDFEDYEI